MKPTSMISLAAFLSAGLSTGLSAQTGFIAIAPLDSGVGRVFLDGKLVGRVRDGWFTVGTDSGMHDLRVKVRGFKEFRARVEVTDGEVTKVNPVLERLSRPNAVLDIEPVVIPADRRAVKREAEQKRKQRLMDAGGVFIEKAVDDLPVRVRCDRIQYVGGFGARGIEEDAFVRGIVGLDGKIEQASVKLERASHKKFGEAALRMFASCTYKPGRIDGKAVRVLITQPVIFGVKR